MFSNISRYRKLPSVVTLDARGRALESKALRLTPPAEPRAQHILEGHDRLDQVAYKYYRQSRNWWRFCDANPEFPSPRALFGKAPDTTGQFLLERDSGSPHWPELRANIARLRGVLAARLGTPDDPRPTTDTLGETTLFADIDPTLAGDLDAAVRTQELPAALVADLDGRGVTLAPEVRISTTEDGGYALAEASGDVVYVLRNAGAFLALAQRNLRHRWTAEITFNREIVTADALCDQVSALQCDVLEPLFIGRVGKPIALPRNVRP